MPNVLCFHLSWEWTSQVSPCPTSGPAAQWGDLGSSYLTDSQSDGPIFNLSPLHFLLPHAAPARAPWRLHSVNWGGYQLSLLLTSDSVLGCFSNPFIIPSVFYLQNLTSVASSHFSLHPCGFMCLWQSPHWRFSGLWEGAKAGACV